MGFTLADKKAGNFKLEIESIKAVKEVATTAAAKGDGDIVSADSLIELAITRGVPLFNDGDEAGCAAVYEITCESLRANPQISKKSRDALKEALTKMREEDSARRKAWILRNALDEIYTDLTADY